ncbi:MAG: anti-sigma regulatory factor [Anaerolineae bacterium]|nr:anti-sigma regulatory factor [Anaerolineae bacterium]
MAEVLRIPISSDLDIVAARVQGRDLARDMGFDVIDQARIATAISELARNVVLYAYSGELLLNRVEPNGRVGLQLVCTDRGPGIENAHEVMRQAHVADAGLSMGLPGARRLMDDFEIESEPGIGTTVTACKWLR